jgi:predicted nucleotidyltransferase
MRVNKNTLLKIADDTVARRVRTKPGILSIYLCGSLLSDDYLIGGTADIDLTIIHIDAAPQEREIVRLTDEIHLDITHYSQRDFRDPRQLRIHPWLGPTIFDCEILHDPQHFMDFTQASVRGQFHNSTYVLNRCRKRIQSARQIWMGFYTDMPAEPGVEEVAAYLKAIENAANTITSLHGPPLAERRLLLNFPERAKAVDRPGLYPGLLGLLGAPNVDHDVIGSWLPGWQAAIEMIPVPDIPPRLNPYRLVYYRRAFKAMLGGDQPQAVLWPLLRTWTLAISCLAEDLDSRGTWEEACRQLGILGGRFADRVEALDAYLDLVEETLEAWEDKAGR